MTHKKVFLSTDTGNTLTLGSDGGIYSPLVIALPDVVISPLLAGPVTTVDVTANDGCVGTSWAVVGQTSNVSVVNNNDGTFDVTAVDCSLPTWQFIYAVTCDNGDTSQARVSGVINPGTLTHSFSQSNASTVNIAIVTSNGSPVDIDWGDGTVVTVPSSTTEVTHTYTTPNSNPIVVTYSACAVIREFRSLANTFNFDIGALPAGLTYFNVQGQNTTSGDIGALPAGLTHYINTGQNTTSGDIGALPAGLTYFNVQGQNTTSGDVGALPAGLTYYINTGQNTTSGDIGALPAGLTYFDVRGQNTTSGDIGALPAGLIYFNVQGQNTTSGDIGALPAGLTSYINTGQNTTSSDIGATWSAAVAGFRQFYWWGIAKTQTEIDNVLAALTNVTSWSTEKLVNLRGANAAPSAAGLASKAIIEGNGATVFVN